MHINTPALVVNKNYYGNYSYLSASIGSSPEAFWAGQSPKTIPIIKENAVASIIENKETLTAHPAKIVISMAKPIPHLVLLLYSGWLKYQAGLAVLTGQKKAPVF
ncbi:MAG: hypothetical protein ABIH27_03250 [Candidatus Omnitrophota bacterium]